MNTFLFFEAGAFLLLAVVFFGRLFLKQPLERIRVTQFGFGMIALLPLLLLIPVGPKWKISYEQAVPPEIAPPSKIEAVSESPEPVREPAKTEPVAESPASKNETTPAAVVVSGEPVKTVSQESVTAMEQPQVAKVVATKSQNPFSLATLFWFAFLTPPFFLALREIRSWLTLRKIVARSEPAPEFLVRYFRQIEKTAEKKVRLRLSGEIAAPMIFGLFRTTLLIPGHLCREGENGTLSACLAHEWSHFRRGDLTTWNFVRLLQYLLWMQPLYWTLRMQLLADQDFLADHDAASLSPDRMDYASILYRLAKNRPPRFQPGAVLGMAGRKSQLRRRIERLADVDSPLANSGRLRNMIPSLVVMLIVVLLAGSVRVVAVSSRAEEPAAVESQPLLFDFAFVQNRPEETDRNKMEKIDLYQRLLYVKKESQEAVRREMLRLAKSLEDRVVGGAMVLDFAKEAWRNKEPDVYQFWFDELEPPFTDWMNAYLEAQRLADGGDHDAAEEVLLKLMPENRLPRQKTSPQEEELEIFANTLAIDRLVELGITDEVVELLKNPYLKIWYGTQSVLYQTDKSKSLVFSDYYQHSFYSESFIMARGLVKLKKYEEVFILAEKLKPYFGFNNHFLNSAIEAMVEQGQVDFLLEKAFPENKSYDTIQEVAARANSPFPMDSLFHAMLRHGDYDKIVETVRRHSLYEKSEMSDWFCNRFLDRLSQEGKVKDYQDFMDEILDHRRDQKWLNSTRTVYPTLIRIWVALGNRAKAEEIYALVQANGKQLEAEGHHFSDKERHILFALAECNAALGNREEALKLWKQVDATAPSYLSAERRSVWEMVAISQARFGFTTEALETITRADIDRPMYAKEIWNLGWQFVEQGDYDAARVILVRLRECADEIKSSRVIGLIMGLERQLRKQ